jgi:hypothetical protein
MKEELKETLAKLNASEIANNNTIDSESKILELPDFDTMANQLLTIQNTSVDLTMKKPNLFIVGAPKCGTTALAAYLDSHPCIFMCRPKEPNYYANALTLPGANLGKQSYHVDLPSYLSLFEPSTEEHLILGEASTRYLRHPPALTSISQLYPEAKMIVCVRNPIDLAISWHAQKVYEGQESVADFGKAWLQEQECGPEQRLLPGLQARDALSYSEIPKLGSQIEFLFQAVAPERVFILVLDDLIRDAQEVFSNILKFLGVSDQKRQAFPVVNQRSEFRWYWIPRVLAGTPEPLRSMIGLDGGLLRQMLYRIGLMPARKGKLSASTKKQLVECFTPEVRKLERILNRDLGHWLK